MRLILSLLFLCCFTGCFSASEYLTDKKEVLLKTTSFKDVGLLSYLGQKDHIDYVALNTHNKLLKASIDGLNAQISSQKDFNLPYENPFMFSYILSAKSSKNNDIRLCVVLDGLAQSQCINIDKTYKSLNFHLKNEFE